MDHNHTFDHCAGQPGTHNHGCQHQSYQEIQYIVRLDFIKEWQHDQGTTGYFSTIEQARTFASRDPRYQIWKVTKEIVQ